MVIPRNCFRSKSSEVKARSMPFHAIETAEPDPKFLLSIFFFYTSTAEMKPFSVNLISLFSFLFEARRLAEESRV